MTVTRRSPALDVTCGLRMTKFYVPQPASPELHNPGGPAVCGSVKVVPQPR